MWPLWLVEMSLQHIQKNSPRLLPKPAKFEKNPPNGYRVIRKTKCGAGGAGGAGGAAGAGGAGGAWSSPIHKQASLAGRLTRDYVLPQCIPGRVVVEAWHTEYYGWHKYTLVVRGLKCLWEQLVLTLSKQNVCLMKDTNVTRHSTSVNWCKLYPPERKLTKVNQPLLNLEAGTQGKTWPHQKILSPWFPIGWHDIANL